jgi:sugar/nucleoside kinase (ribokinase family)
MSAPLNDSDSILTVGSMAFDTIETPSGKADQVLGGSANYFSIAASNFSPVKIVAVVGTDFPIKHLDWLRSRKVDVQGVEIADGKTFHWVGEYNQNLNEAKTLSTMLNVFEHFNPVLSPEHKSCPYVFLANIDPDIQLNLLEQVDSPRLVAADTMNFWITGKREPLLKVLKKVDILSVNEGEAFQLAGCNNLLEAADKVLKLGPSVVIIKQGEYGAAMFTQSTVFIAPAFPLRKVVDPTGAGDSFAGAMMGYLAQKSIHKDLMKTDPRKWDRTLRQAVLSGCVMASFTVEDFSIERLSRLERHELDKRLLELKQMIDPN